LQRIVQIEGGHQRFRDGVEHQQFAIPPPDLLLRAPPFRHIQQESLIRGDVSGRIADGRGRLADRAGFPILAANLKLKVVDGPVFLEKPFEAFAIQRIHIQCQRNLHAKKFITILIADDTHQRTVEIQEASL
jgi:hypothetical protein